MEMGHRLDGFKHIFAHSGGGVYTLADVENRAWLVSKRGPG